MTKKEVAKLLYEAGWTDAINLPKMLAVVYAEAELFTEAWHYNPPTPEHPNGTTDWGYPQLNDQGKTGAELEAFKVMAFDPVTATAYARTLFKQRGFQPWVAYNSGAYKEHIPAANIGVGNMIRERLGIPPG